MPFPMKKPAEGSAAEERGESPAAERAEQRGDLKHKKGRKQGVGVHDMPLGKVEPNELFMPSKGG